MEAVLSWFLAGLFAFNVACGGDALTTDRVIAAGGREAWLPVRSRPAVDGILVGECLAVDAQAAAVRRSSRKTQVIVFVAVTAFHGYAAYHNAMLLRNHP